MKGYDSKSIFPDNSYLLQDYDRTSEVRRKLQSVNLLHLLSAVLQVVLGLSVVLLSMLDLVEYRWMSTLLIMLGSVTAMVGMFFLYTVVAGRRSTGGLIRDAVHRIMNAHN